MSIFNTNNLLSIAKPAVQGLYTTFRIFSDSQQIEPGQSLIQKLILQKT